MQSIPLPNGAQISLATTFAAATAISAISNAATAVASSVAHTLSDGDVLLMTVPGWARVDGSVCRVSAQTTDAFSLEGVNSLDASRFPPTGAGSGKKITGWTSIPKVPTFETTGGDAKSQTTGYLDYEKDIEMFTGANPQRLNLSISYAPGTPAYDALAAASDSGEMQVIRLLLKDGSALYYPGQIFFNKTPTTTKDQEMVNNVSLALQGEFSRFAKFVP